MQSTPSKIWYKQFWPWFLIFVPLMSMVLSFTMMRLAFNSEDSMVVDDYYKEGKGINLKFQKVENAKNLNIKTSIEISSDYAAITFLAGAPTQGEVLTLNFFHATQDFKDFSVTLLRDAKGVYRAPLEQDVTGKWQITLQPFDESWKIQKVVTLPRAAAFEFNP
ncbi:FixH family protein [Paraglaciecola sp. 2405UD69-4]|uniref:FixH family protein n=1 Tax=Paraglaciecola sp. 2405UD69-4 TaxID=3391836 RepID=UPI0039C8C857